MPNGFYGSDAQRKLMAKSLSLWRLTRGHPALCWQGRMVAIDASAVPDPVELAADVVRVQGATNLHFLPDRDSLATEAALIARGLAVTVFDQHTGEADAIAAAEARLGGGPPSAELRPVWLDRDSPGALLDAVAAVSLAGGVTPACAFAMRGEGPPCAVLALCDATGVPVASGLSMMGYAAASPRFGTAFWGMLATRDDWRGRGLASWIGAALIRRMADRHGVRCFFTGVHRDNPGSARLCTRLGVPRSPHALISCSDPLAFPAGRITR